MLDLLALVSIGLLFGLSAAYLYGCEHLKGRPIVILDIVLLILSALLMVYLVFALLRPEKF